jgi:CRP-like cAMP-binding protein
LGLARPSARSAILYLQGGMKVSRKSKSEYHIVGNYKMIPENTLLSKEFQNIRPTELKIYICFLTYWVRNGKNENRVKMTIDEIAENTNLSRPTILKSLNGLRKKGFIDYIGIRNITTSYTLNKDYLTGRICRQVK